MGVESLRGHHGDAPNGMTRYQFNGIHSCVNMGASGDSNFAVAQGG